MEALTSLTGTALRQNLDAWRTELRQTLLNDADGILGRRQPRLAATVPDTFPNVSVARKYLDPLTSWSSRSTGNIPNAALWEAREPDIGKITRFCIDKLGWDNSESSHNLLKKFQKNLWPGVALRMLSSVDVPFISIKYVPDFLHQRYILYSSAKLFFATPSTNATLVSIIKRDTSKNGLYTLLRIRVSTGNFVKLTEYGTIGDLEDATSSESVLVSIPEPILAVAMRDLSLSTTPMTVDVRFNCSLRF